MNKKKPVLVYDGDCSFCRYWVLRWRHITREGVDYAPYQDVAEQYPQISLEQFKSFVYLIFPDNRVFKGAEAVFRALAESPGKTGWLWMYQNIPGFKLTSELIYRLIASRRLFFSQVTTLLWGREVSPSTYVISAWIFLRLMAVFYAMAFVSLGFQISGLVGSNGILPVGSILEKVAGQTGIERFWFLPTVFWLNASDAVLKGACLAGFIFSCAAALGFYPAVFLALNWLLYLSFVSVCGNFLHFQWDALLLEAGFLSLFIAPLSKRAGFPRRVRPPSVLILWLFRWLLFRLMFSSGMVKILSGDESWRRLEALKVHYETQPLPTWVGWYAHQLPAAVHRYSTVAMFVIELAVPFLIFTPRRPRTLAAFLMIFLQSLIVLTGNYCFFNFLTTALCLLLIEDLTWPSLWRKYFMVRPRQEGPPVPLFRGLRAAVFVFLFFFTSYIFTSRLFGMRWPRFITTAAIAVSPLELANHYGLFAVMTTIRPEISVEGSRDGKSWLAYEFKYKPGRLDKRPGFVAPHQPRLDWQMWFAALGSIESNPWFVRFCYQLLKGSPDVLSLLRTNPFPEGPPKYIRAVVYDYRFTNSETKRETGNWWQRGAGRLYCPVLNLESFDASSTLLS